MLVLFFVFSPLQPTIRILFIIQYQNKVKSDAKKY